MVKIQNLIRNFGGDVLTCLSYVKIGADSQKSSLIDSTHHILAILAFFWPPNDNLTTFGQINNNLCVDILINLYNVLHSKECADYTKMCLIDLSQDI